MKFDDLLWFVIAAIYVATWLLSSAWRGRSGWQGSVYRMFHARKDKQPSGPKPQQEERPVTGRLPEGDGVIARSIYGERVEHVGNQLWLVREDGSRDEVTDAWLEQVLRTTAWRKEGEAPVEIPQLSVQETEQPIRPPSREEEISTETPSQHDRREAQRAMHQLWEMEIASDLSFRDRITPDMLVHVPKEQRARALQEYARLHPDEAYWDGEALVWKGKAKE